jgi:hypothetical protein
MLTYVRLTCVLALSGLALSAQTVAVAPKVKTTGVIGLAQGETAQLNLLNPGVQAPAAGVLCTAAVTFFDAAGATLKTATVSVAPRTAGAVNLSANTDLSIAAGARRDIRAQFTFPAVPAPAATSSTPIIPVSCSLTSTLEIFDSVTGRTLVSLGGSHDVPTAVVTPAN